LTDRQTLRWFTCLIVAGLFSAFNPSCVYDPAYNGTLCESNGDCPPGYSCTAYRCYLDNDEVNLEEPSEEVSLDADGEPDAGHDGGLDGGDDGSLDDGDQTGDDGQDGGSDDAGADEGPCGGCIEGYYCNEGSGTCHPCQVDEHCGEACVDCVGGSCTEFDGNFCCLGDCTYANGCQLVQCEDVGVICRSIDFVPNYAWTRDNVDLPHYCLLSDQAGPVAGSYACFDDEYLRFSCPWDGLCNTGGCVDQIVERTHTCGQAWGCDQSSGLCRTYLKNDQSCAFNFDCDSFCCSRDQNGSCIAFDQSACKIYETQFTDLFDLYTWTAYNAQNPHDLSLWSRADGHNGPSCTHDRECDSGNCRYFVSVLEDRCDFHDCVDDPGAGNIRNTYFCPSGDHATHVDLVTNQDVDRFPDQSRCD